MTKKSITTYFISILIAVVFFGISLFFLKSSRTMPACANSKTCNKDLSLKIENHVSGTFAGRRVNPPVIDLSSEKNFTVLGVATSSGEKRIYIDLSTQTLVALEGSKQILKTLVSTGKWGKTPTGNFHIWEKLRATRMSGGEGADAYDLPNVPYVMYFYGDFGLHGAYWHDNFGHVMSHGCINLRAVDAKVLFEWTDGPNGQTKGTQVSVCDQITNDKQCIQNNPVQI